MLRSRLIVGKGPSAPLACSGRSPRTAEFNDLSLEYGTGCEELPSGPEVKRFGLADVLKFILELEKVRMRAG